MKQKSRYSVIDGCKIQIVEFPHPLVYNKLHKHCQPSDRPWQRAIISRTKSEGDSLPSAECESRHKGNSGPGQRPGNLTEGSKVVPEAYSFTLYTLCSVRCSVLFSNVGLVFVVGCQPRLVWSC